MKVDFNIAEGLIVSAMYPVWNDGMAYIKSKKLGEMASLERYDFLFKASCDCASCLDTHILHGSTLRESYPLNHKERVSYTADAFLCVDKLAIPSLPDKSSKYFLLERGWCALDWLKTAKLCGFLLTIPERNPRALLKYLLLDLWNDRKDVWLRNKAYFWNDFYPDYKL